MDTLLEIIGRIAYQTEGDETSYRAMLAPEEIETSDGRFIQAGALEWRDGRLPLMWSDSEMGHGDAVHVGNLENLRKETVDGVVWVVADVDWDDDEQATEARRLVDEDRLTGVSIHMADMDADFECDDDDENCLLTVTHGVIAAATIVAIPAFEDAEIEPIAAAATPVDLFAPPRRWFNDPKLTEPTFMTVTDDGRVFGHVTPGPDAADCHLGFPFTCVRPPTGNVDYEEFHAHARVQTDDGATLPVGVLTFGGGHAPTDRPLTPAEAMKHYEESTTVGGYVRVGEDAHGTWIAGAVAPGLSRKDIETLRRLSLSGDWRPRGDTFVFAAALAVPVPGFSVKAHVASGMQTSLITMGPSPAAPSDLSLVAAAIGTMDARIAGIETHLTAEWKREQLAEAFATFGGDED